MDCLVLPLQERLEDWKKTVLTLDKEHAKGMVVLGIFSNFIFFYYITKI